MRYFDPVNIGKRVSKSCALTHEFRLMPGLAEKREAVVLRNAVLERVRSDVV